MANFVRWEFWDASLNQWSALPSNDSTTLEQHFNSGDASQLTVHPNKIFDVNLMQYPNNVPVRRCKKDPNISSAYCCAYFDGTAWIELNPYISTLIIDAKRCSRQVTGFYVDDQAYTVNLHYMPVQLNRASGTVRPVFVPEIVHVVGDDDDKVDAEEKDYEELESNLQNMPEQLSKTLICPITNAPMRKPVVASDGFSYERDAIVRWFMKKNTSPMTGKVMHDLSLRMNHNMRMIIDAFTPTIKKEKKRHLSKKSSKLSKKSN